MGFFIIGEAELHSGYMIAFNSYLASPGNADGKLKKVYINSLAVCTRYIPEKRRLNYGKQYKKHLKGGGLRL